MAGNFLGGNFLAGNFLSHVVIFGNFMALNFLGGNFLGGYLPKHIQNQANKHGLFCEHTILGVYLCCLTMYVELLYYIVSMHKQILAE